MIPPGFSQIWHSHLISFWTWIWFLTPPIVKRLWCFVGWNAKVQMVFISILWDAEILLTFRGEASDQFKLAKSSTMTADKWWYIITRSLGGQIGYRVGATRWNCVVESKDYCFDLIAHYRSWKFAENLGHPNTTLKPDPPFFLSLTILWKEKNLLVRL